jgi:small subunit ribosomal protein S17
MENKKKILVGEVISDKMDKTVVAMVVRDYQHPEFKKVMRQTKKYKVHDEKEEAKTGDRIEFFQGRPASKSKYMYLSRVIAKG